MGSRSLGGCVLALAVVMLVPATASAHAYVMQPPARDLVSQADKDARAHKFGPCGGVGRTGTPTQYEVGAEIEVKWEETIGHIGCYQIAFSPANDKDWVTLAQIDDPGNSQGVQSTKVKLPAGVSCKDCTLVVRQIMLNAICPPNAVPNATSAGDTYFSCADIRVGDFPDAGPSEPPKDDEDESDGGTSSGGVSTTPTDGGGKTNGGSRRLNSTDSDEGGCSIAVGATGGFSLFASAGLGLLALARRRRRGRQ